MYYSILKSGKKITIKDDNKVYAPTTFYCEGDDVRFDNKEFGYDCVHKPFTTDHNAFEEHVNNMLAEGMTLVIKQK